MQQVLIPVCQRVPVRGRLAPELFQQGPLRRPGRGDQLLPLLTQDLVFFSDGALKYLPDGAEVPDARHVAVRVLKVGLQPLIDVLLLRIVFLPRLATHILQHGGDEVRGLAAAEHTVCRAVPTAGPLTELLDLPPGPLAQLGACLLQSFPQAQAGRDRPEAASEGPETAQRICLAGLLPGGQEVQHRAVRLASHQDQPLHALIGQLLGQEQPIAAVQETAGLAEEEYHIADLQEPLGLVCSGGDRVVEARGIHNGELPQFLLVYAKGHKFHQRGVLPILPYIIVQHILQFLHTATGDRLNLVQLL